MAGKLAKGFVVVVIVLAVVIGVTLGVFAARWRPMFPDTPLPEITATTDPAVVERGSYIVNALAHCGACHSKRETYAGTAPGQLQDLSGGFEWSMGPLGTIRSKNITPDETTGIGAWSDAEIARAVRHGVGRDGRGLLYMMAVGPMSDEDLTAVVSYLRTVPPVQREVAESEVGLLGKVLFQTAMSFFAAPHDYQNTLPPYVPEGPASVERGTYLAQGPAACMGCHSNIVPEGRSITFDGPVGAGNSSQPMPDMDDPEYEYAGPNLTPDPETGHIAAWSKEQFLERMRAGRTYASSPMPWETYRNMTQEDLESLWLWTQSLPPTHRDTGPPHRKRG